MQEFYFPLATRHDIELIEHDIELMVYDIELVERKFCPCCKLLQEFSFSKSPTAPLKSIGTPLEFYACFCACLFVPSELRTRPN